MARLDVHQVRGGLALDCQANALRRMPTRFVVPLEPNNPALLVNEQLNPKFSIGGRTLLMVTQLAGTVRARDLGEVIASLRGDEAELAVQRALDMLTSGV